jgi:hypothetical protein
MSVASFIKCKCDEIFDDRDFLGHFPSCQQFKRDFKNFDQKFAEILREYSDPKENLLIVRVLLNQYKNMIDNRIKQLNIVVHNPNAIRQPSFPKQNNGSNGNDRPDRINDSNLNIDPNDKNPNINKNPRNNSPIVKQQNPDFKKINDPLMDIDSFLGKGIIYNIKS